MGVEDKTDKSEDYEKFDEIPPFTVKTDPSILLNDEDYPWLRRNKQGTHAKIIHDYDAISKGHTRRKSEDFLSSEFSDL